MQIVIARRNRKSVEAVIDGLAPRCQKCRHELFFIVKEAVAKDEPASIHWYCTTCEHYTLASNAMGMLY